MVLEGQVEELFVSKHALVIDVFFFRQGASMSKTTACVLW